MPILAALTLALVAATLYVEWRGRAHLVWATKPLASVGFVAVAIAAGAWHSPYGRFILAGLLLSLVGDVRLIPDARRAFLAGIGSFLAAHVAYVVAFAGVGLAPVRVLLAALVLVPFAFAVHHALAPHLGNLAGAVVAYIAVITVMAIAAAGTTAQPGWPLRLGGAVLFFLSDLAVARQRFLGTGLADKLWGYPFYYGGQLLLAASVAQAASPQA